jgi:hypothetical protein
MRPLEAGGGGEPDVTAPGGTLSLLSTCGDLRCRSIEVFVGGTIAFVIVVMVAAVVVATVFVPWPERRPDAAPGLRWTGHSTRTTGP